MLSIPKPAEIPTGRKPEGFSNPNLVALRRRTYIHVVKMKLMGKPYLVTEGYLQRIDKELQRRKITIQDPELT